MITRDWASVDYYATLGVSRDATADEIADAFRALAKQLHPDIARDELPGTERFKDITAAYEVLSDDDQRADYDRIFDRRATVSDPDGALGSTLVAPRRAGFVAWSPGRARAAIVAGLVCFVAGIAFSGFIVALNQREADERAARVPVLATVVQGAPATRAAFTATPGGPLTVVPIGADPSIGASAAPDVPAGGTKVDVAFDPSAPTSAVLADRAPADFAARALATVVDTAGAPQLVFAVSGVDAPAVVAEPRSRRGMPLRDGQQIAIRYSPADPADIRIDDTDSGRNFAFWFVAVKLLVAGPLLAAFGIIRLRQYGQPGQPGARARTRARARSTSRPVPAR